MERVVIALGGNALLRRGADDTFEEMYRSARGAAEKVADGDGLGGRGHARQRAAGGADPPPAGIGQGVGPPHAPRRLRGREPGPDRQPPPGHDQRRLLRAGDRAPGGHRAHADAGRPDDPAFRDPTKPVGPFYEEEEAGKLAEERGWALKPDPHGGWRRVVPSPAPNSIVEAPVIRQLVADGVVVIASGGGGVPVIEEGPRLVGVEGVVDKDLAASILARDVEASVVLILTDVKAVQRGYETDHAERIEHLSVEEARRMLEARELAAGSMRPKVQAAVGFVEAGGKRAVVAGLEDAPAALGGKAGNTIS